MNSMKLYLPATESYVVRQCKYRTGLVQTPICFSNCCQ